MNTTKKYGKRIDLALSLWVKLARAYSTFRKKTSENISAFGLTEPQFSVLECLGHLGPMKIGALSAKQLVTGGNMTLVIDNLEKEGLVQRVHSKEDRREIIIHMTEKGKNLFDTIFKKHAEFIADICSILNEREQEDLSKLLKKLGTALQETHR
jgi:MarR family 2-MHQ and catechol resistance regulon transcriptional repressor